jgi:hypothetical protein
MISRDVAQPGRAQRSGRWGRAFKSRRPDQPKTTHQARLKNSENHVEFCAGFAIASSPMKLGTLIKL